MHSTHKESSIQQALAPSPSIESDRTAVFSIRHLSKVYGEGHAAVHALRDVSIDFYEHELAVLLGPSGSGKSTLLNIVGGIDVASSGQVFYKSTEITDYNDRQLTRYRREHIGFVFQFYNLIPSLTAKENVELVTELSTNPLKAEDALEMVGMQHRLNHFPAELSGGEQQRVAISRALAKRPSILLCDEPTGALDSSTGVQVLSALQTANSEFGTTTIIITHNVGIQKMANRVLHFLDGQVVKTQVNEHQISAEEISW